MKKTPEQEIELLRKAMHNAMMHLEKDGSIFKRDKKHIISAYIILERAFMDTAHGYSVVMSDSDKKNITSI